MTTTPQPLPNPAELVSDHIPDTAFVLARRRLRDGEGSGPRFSDDRWDLGPAHHVPNKHPGSMVVLFDRITDPLWRLTAKEYVHARLTIPVAGSGRLPTVLTVCREALVLRRLFAHLHRHHPGVRLSDIRDDEILAGFLTETTAGTAPHWQAQDRARVAWTLTLLHRVGEHLTHDQLWHLPFGGRRPAQVAGRRSTAENRTPRIPAPVLGPLLRGALFYVHTAAADILAAEAERQVLEAAAASTDPGIEETLRRLDMFAERRRAEGRGLPGQRTLSRSAQPDRPNRGLVATMIGVPPTALRPPRAEQRVRDLAAELGLEPGGMNTPISIDPGTGLPWRARFDPGAVLVERRRLATAAYVVIAYLSGMRDSEVQSLRRGCHFTEPTADGVLVRHKLRGTVYRPATRTASPTPGS